MNNLSQEIADILINIGKEHWLQKREEKMLAK
jgi:hypothetical protein